MRVWACGSQSCAVKLAGGTGQPLDCVRLHPSVPSTLGVSDNRSNAVVWDIAAEKEATVLNLHSRVCTIEWSPDGRLLCALCEDGYVRGVDPRDDGSK